VSRGGFRKGGFDRFGGFRGTALARNRFSFGLQLLARYSYDLLVRIRIFVLSIRLLFRMRTIRGLRFV